MSLLYLKNPLKCGRGTGKVAPPLSLLPLSRASERCRVAVMKNTVRNLPFTSY